MPLTAGTRIGADPDGRYIVYRQMNPKTGWDLMLLPVTGDR